MHTKLPAQIATIEIRLMDDIKLVKPFSELAKIDISKNDIFQFGILTWEVPVHIREDDFEYLQGRLPAFQQFNDDYISLKPSAVVTNARGESAIKISEIIGVGVGLAYATKLLSVVANRVKKIGRDGTKKRLDFEILKDGKRYEVETRSTSYSSSINRMLTEVLAKKAEQEDTAIRFGAVTLSRSPDDTGQSYISVCDDNDETRVTTEKYRITDFINYYLPVLSLVLDSHYFNILSKNLEKGRIRKRMIKADKIKKRIKHEGFTYCGDAFDRRLILKKVRENARTNESSETVLRRLTNVEGVHQTFIGIDERLIDMLNANDLEGVTVYRGEKFYEEHGTYTIGSTGDGVIVIEILEDSPSYLRALLPREEIKERLSQVIRYSEGGEKPMCGAPCRSREIEGKPCEIRTYRGHCHFHR
jgi:hypothetical protein